MTLPHTHHTIASIVMAAGRGSRMKGYSGNKTLLPLAPAASVFIGRRPIILHLLQNLPAGPKALVVNHCKDEVVATTRATGVFYCDQPVLNGTGGAVLAAADFVAAQSAPSLIITMGDVPFVQKATYSALIRGLETHDLMVLGFAPRDKRQYGVLEIEKGAVKKITEWKFWRDYPVQRRQQLRICNSGIYAVRTSVLRHYLPILAGRPQVVQKEVDGKLRDVEEFFFTDLIETLVEDGKRVGCHVVDDEWETMGIDDVGALEKAQAIYADLAR